MQVSQEVNAQQLARLLRLRQTTEPQPPNGDFGGFP